MQRNIGAKLPTTQVLTVIGLGPQSGEKCRKGFDRIDLSGQVVVWAAVLVDICHRLLRAGPIDLRQPRTAGRLDDARGIGPAAGIGTADDRDRGGTGGRNRPATSAAVTVPGLTASIPPDASRFAANVARMLCSASGPSGSSSTGGRAPDFSR